MRRVFGSAAALVGAVGASAQVSPFEDVTWSDEGLTEVLVEGRWWEPVSINGVSFGELWTFALEEYESVEQAQKRIDEDLLEVFARLGAPAPGETVELELRAEGDPGVTRLRVEMTEENRRRLWQIRERSERARVHAAHTVRTASFAPAEARAVLDALAGVLSTRHAYSIARKVDLAAAAERAKSTLNADPVSPAALAREVRRVLALAGDGHARVLGDLGDARSLGPGGRLPLAAMPLDLREGGRVVAVEGDGRRLLDPRHPYLVAIDGVEIERWLEIAGEIVAGGSPQARRAGACEEIPRMGWIRERLGLPPQPTALVTLESERGDRIEKKIGTRPADAEPYRHSARRTSGRTPPAIAYIPIPEMYSRSGDADEYEEVGRALRAAGRAQGVVIDVRGNRGGTRDILHLVAAALMGPQDPPVVYSAARPLLWPGREREALREQLEGRYLFPADSDRWSEAERRAIGEFLARFEPEVKLPDDRFGPLHVSVLSPGGENVGALAGRPVVVLMDEECVSAADVFLAAMAELPGVTLIGRPSSGASGMSTEHLIAGDDFVPIPVRLASMVSFMPDGRVFDWHGVTPDVVVPLTPADFTRSGPDTALDAAVDRLQTRRD